MHFKKILPYLLFSTMTVLPGHIGTFNAVDGSLSAKKTVKLDAKSRAAKLEQKATELCNAYIEQVLRGQKNINESKRGYRHAVLKELPGAPVGMHCVYGQYTQLNRVLTELGDTINIIPFHGRSACPAFRNEMREKYSAPEYIGAIHNGKMMKPAAYKSALVAFLKRHNITETTPDSTRQKVIEKFEKTHFSVESLHPGSILIIQKSANPNNTHAVMFLGRGYVNNGEFVPDSTGAFMYAGYNNESVGDIFTTFNTNHIFAADIHDIALVAYTQELENLKNMDDEELFHFIYDIPQNFYAIAPNRKYMESMAETKYFDKSQKFPAPLLTANKNTASVKLIPGLAFTKNR